MCETTSAAKLCFDHASIVLACAGLGLICTGLDVVYLCVGALAPGPYADFGMGGGSCSQ